MVHMYIDEINALVGTSILSEQRYLRECLIQAAVQGRTEIVEILLRNGVNVNHTDVFGKTPLLHAASRGYTEIVDLLLQNGANVNHADGRRWTALTMAAVNNHTQTVALLLQNGANVDQVDVSGDTPLLNAARHGLTQIVNLLLQNGANVNQADRYGQTPLIYAAGNNHTQTVALLLQNGANVNQFDRDGNTPLLRVIIRPDRNSQQKLNTVELLLNHGADIAHRNLSGVTPLIEATRLSPIDFDLLMLLLSKGANSAELSPELYSQVPTPYNELQRLERENRARIEEEAVSSLLELLPAIHPGDPCPVCLENALLDAEGVQIEPLASSLFFNCRHGMHQACYQDVIGVCPICRALPKKKA